MAAINKKRKTNTVRVKKKRWYPIFAPKQFQESLLGETYVSESTDIDNKFLTANLSTIMKRMRKQNVNIHFKVTEVKDGKGYTSIVGYSLINAAIKRLVRKGRDKIDDSFIAKTSDKKVLRLKPLIISMNKGTKSVQSALRLESRRIIREFVFTKTVEEVFNDIIEGRLAKQIKDAIGKIAPVKTVEFRMVKLEENTKIVVTDKAVKSEEVTIRSKDKGELHISEEELAALKAAEQAKLAEEAANAAQEAEDSENSEDFGDDSEEETEEELLVESEDDSEEFGDSEESNEVSDDVSKKVKSEDNSVVKEVSNESDSVDESSNEAESKEE